MASGDETGRGCDEQTFSYVLYRNNIHNAQLLKVSLLGVNTVVRFEGDLWSMFM